MKGSEYVRQVQDAVVENVGLLGGVSLSAAWLSAKLGVIRTHMERLELEREAWKDLAKQWQEYAESLESKKNRKVQIVAAKARVSADKSRGVETEQWIVDLANEGD